MNISSDDHLFRGGVHLGHSSGSGLLMSTQSQSSLQSSSTCRSSRLRIRPIGTWHGLATTHLSFDFFLFLGFSSAQKSMSGGSKSNFTVEGLFGRSEQHLSDLVSFKIGLDEHPEKGIIISQVGRLLLRCISRNFVARLGLTLKF